MMRELPLVTTNIHGTPACARYHEETAGVVISTTDPYYSGSCVTFFCDDRDLAQKLAAAINSTIEAHAADLAQRTSIQEAAE